MTPTLEPLAGVVVLVLLVGAAAPALVAVCRGEPGERLVALQSLAATLTVVLVVLAVGLGRSSYLDVPLVLALVSLAGSLVFARFFGRAL